LNVTRYTLNIIRKEGVSGLYRGFLPAMLGSFPGQFSYYVAYEYANEKLSEAFKYSGVMQKQNLLVDGMIGHALAGLIAEMVCAFAYLPTDIISQRLQIERVNDFRHLKFQNKSSLEVISSIWKMEGARGFFRGYYAYVMVYGPSSAVWWASYESFKKAFHISFNSLEAVLKRSVPFKRDMNHLLSGALAGILSVVVTNPLDVARTRIQLLEVENARERRELNEGFSQMLKKIVQKEGFRGLYKGMKPRVFVKIPGSAIAFLGYEWLKQSSLNDESATNKIY
jgi:solute carrier family 25 protein 44